MRGMSTRAAATAFVALLACGIGEARADGGQDAAMAEALFQDGRTLLAQGRTSEACGKFASSERIDPQIGTMLFLASCHQAEGKTATAWGEYSTALAALQRAPDPRREAYARQQIAALATKLSRLVLTTRAPVAGLAVQVDAHSLDAATLGTPLPVDAGPHTIVASAPLYRAWSATVDVADGPIDVELTIPPLEPLGRARPAAPAPVPAPALAPTASGRRALAFAAGGVGIAGLVVGAVAGSWAIVDKQRADDGSCSGRFCTPHGLDLYSQAGTAAWVSTGGFAVAAVGLGVGTAALLLSAPRKTGAASVRVSPTLGGATITATW